MEREELEQIVDDLFERTDAAAHAIMHEIARLAIGRCDDVSE